MIPFGETRRLPIFPFIVYALVALNVYVFVQELAAPSTDGYINSLAAIPYDITNNIRLPAPSPALPVLTIVTSMFLHGSFLHIFFNMLFLLVFGPDIEYLCGHVRFSAAVYALRHRRWAGDGLGRSRQSRSGDRSVGRHRRCPRRVYHQLSANRDQYDRAGRLPAALFFRLPAFLVIGVWAAVQFIHGLGQLTNNVSSEQGGTAYFAHIGGFCAGVLSIGFFRVRTAKVRRSA